MSSPFPQTLIILSYIYFVKTLGPRLMENRKPFDLKQPMIIYNFGIVVFSLYMIYEVGNHGGLSVPVDIIQEALYSYTVVLHDLGYEQEPIKWSSFFFFRMGGVRIPELSLNLMIFFNEGVERCAQNRTFNVNESIFFSPSSFSCLAGPMDTHTGVTLWTTPAHHKLSG